MTKEIPHAALVASLDADGLALLSAALDERHSREELGFGTFAGAAVRGQEVALREPMGRGSPPPIGAAFDSSKASLPAWTRFIRLMRRNVPLDCAAELCGLSHQTAFEWRHRMLAIVSGHQARVVLRDRVWIDERLTSTTPTSPRATARRASTDFPAKSCASASPSTCTRTPSPRSAGTASPAQRG